MIETADGRHRAARRRRLPDPDRRLRSRWPTTSSATAAGTATRSGRTSARPAARASSTAAARTPRSRSTPRRPSRAPRTSASTSTSCRRGSARSSSSGAATPAAATCSTATQTVAGRHPESDIFLDDVTVSRRHAEILRDGDAYTVRDVGLAQRHLPEPEPGGGSSPARRRRAADRDPSSWSSSTATHERRDGGAGAPVDRRGPLAGAGGLPRHHDLQDPLPRVPGAARPRAHAVGLPQVLRRRHRAPAVDPRPAARPLPAAEGDPRAPRRVGRHRHATRRRPPDPAAEACRRDHGDVEPDHAGPDGVDPIGTDPAAPMPASRRDVRHAAASLAAASAIEVDPTPTGAGGHRPRGTRRHPSPGTARRAAGRCAGRLVADRRGARRARPASGSRPSTSWRGSR